MFTEQEKIQKILDFNETQYNEEFLEAGLLFFEARFGDWKEFEFVRRSPVLWKWWNSVYNLFDKQFIEKINQSNYELNKSQLRQLYKHLHSSEEIIISPGRVVMDCIYPYFNDKKQKVQIS